VFQSFEWLSTWQRHIGAPQGVRPAIVIGRGPDRAILFLLPLATQRCAFTRELVWLGMQLCDYTGPLLAADFSARVDRETFASIWRELLRTLSAHPRFGFDLVRLEKMPETVGAQTNPLLCLPVSRNPSGAYQTPLMPTWDEFYAAKRSGSTRRRDRSKRKHLEAIGNVQFVEPATDGERRETLETLMQQKARSFARMGVANLFERPGYAAFYRAVSSEPIAHVSRLDIGSHPGAINLGLMARGRYYHLLASYTDESEYARLGPGAAHLLEMMANAIRRGCTIFDFTIGDEPYKLDWCEARQTLHDHLSARTAAGAIIVAARTMALSIKRTIKESAALWSAFYKLRAMAGKLITLK
jgi:CelD/BcsL family acetyltransferase involved in cellulose biosynthesis